MARQSNQWQGNTTLLVIVSSDGAWRSMQSNETSESGFGKIGTLDPRGDEYMAVIRLTLRMVDRTNVELAGEESAGEMPAPGSFLTFSTRLELDEIPCLLRKSS